MIRLTDHGSLIEMIRITDHVHRSLSLTRITDHSNDPWSDGAFFRMSNLFFFFFYNFCIILFDIYKEESYMRKYLQMKWAKIRSVCKKQKIKEETSSHQSTNILPLSLRLAARILSFIIHTIRIVVIFQRLNHSNSIRNVYHGSRM